MATEQQELSAVISELGLDHQNKGTIGRLLNHGGLGHVEEGADGRMSATIRITEDELIYSPSILVMPHGGELEIESTICNQIRQSGELVVIDDVACDATFRLHHTPKRYGFQSYISVPIYVPMRVSSAPCARSTSGRLASTTYRPSACSSCSLI